VRDGFGSLVGIGLNPLAYARYTGDKAVGASLLLGPGLDARASEDKDLKALSASATDLYASFRSYYLQNRRAEITGGRIDLHSLPDFDDGSPRAADLSPPPPTTKDGVAQP
jgi:phospholipid-binding lipoprotein MlaA